MSHFPLSRRLVVFGGLAALPGCSTLSALNDVTTPEPTYDLSPVPGTTSGARSRASFVLTGPVAPAVLKSDRILVRPVPAAVTYLPDARWPEEVPSMVQSLLIRSLSGTGRIGYVGPSGEGPVPDYALLSRVDAFEITVELAPDGTDLFTANVDLNMTVVRDATQEVIASRSFANSASVADTSAGAVVAAFQAILNNLLPDLTDWVIATAR